MATKQRNETDDESKPTSHYESNHRQNNAKLEDEMMNLTAVTSAKQLAASAAAAACDDAAERLALSSGNGNNRGASAQRNLHRSVRNSNKPVNNPLETDKSNFNLMPRIQPQQHKICRHHQQQLRRSICSNHHNHPQLVGEHHHVPRQHHAHQAHCVHHPAHPKHKHHQVHHQHQQRHHDCASTDTYLKQPVASCRQRHQSERPQHMIRGERLRNHHQHHHQHHSHTDEDASRKRGRTQTTATGGGSTNLNISDGLIVHQQQQQQPTSKRTTMRFISQLYFLIHLSAILSLLLHHKNLVTSETWRLHQASTHRQATPTTAQDTSNSSFIHLTRRHNEHDNNHRNETMPSHINQLPIPLMLLGTIRSFVPDPTSEKSTPTTQTTTLTERQPAADDARPRRTLPQVLITPAMGSSGADILIRLFGYRHARWALHYFLAYLLCSSILMLACMRIFRRRNSSNSSSCNCCQSERNQETGRSSSLVQLGGGHLGGAAAAVAVNPVKSSTSPFATAFGGFYYRTRLDCTPVLVGSISLGFIQLIVIGLDIAAKVDWLSSSATPNPGESNNRWPIYLPFLQFAFVSLLMQFILSKVAKNNNQAAAATNSLLETRHLATNARIPTAANSQKLLLSPAESKALVEAAAATSRHQKHLKKQQQQQQVENNGKRRPSGLQNIALAHLLVTHILLWLMKLNSISLFQAIEQPFVYSSLQQQQHSSRSRSTLSLPTTTTTTTILHNSNEQPKLISADKSGAGEHDNGRHSRSRHLISTSTTTTTLPPRTEREFDRMEREINRPEREFNRTEMEKILRRKLPSLTMVNLNASATTQQVSQHSPSTVAYEGGGQYRRSSTATTNHNDTTNSAHQRPPPPAVGVDGEQKLGVADFGSVGVLAPEFPVKFTLESAGGNTTTANNDSILVNKAQFANLIDLATKNVRLRVAASSPVMPTATTTTSSTTTQRPQFKSSLPKRMTSFRQIQNKSASILPAITGPPSAARPNTTPPPPPPPTTTTTTRMPPDVTKIISLAPPKQRIKVHVIRDDGLTPAGVLGEDDYPARATPAVGESLENEDDDVARRPPPRAPITTERPFPSVDSDPPLENRLDPDEAGHTPAATIASHERDGGDEDRATITATTEVPPSTGDHFGDGADEADPGSGEFDLPPVPNYDEQNSNETGSNAADPTDEQSSQISLAQTSPLADQTATNNLTERLGDLLSDYLVSDARYSDRESSRPDHDEEQPSVSDYLLPIVYQYHILIIAILFNMWLDSLRCALPTGQSSAGAMIGGQFSSIRESRNRQQASRSRFVRSRSMESRLANRAHHGRSHRASSQDWEETSSTSSSLNSVRASSEQLLWVSSSGEHHQLRAGGADRADPDSASISSSESPAKRREELEMRFIATHEEPPTNSHSACSVLFGLIIVSAALIVILLGLELLIILNQCATQLLSIMVCLVGLCLSCRSQLGGRKRATDQLARRYGHAVPSGGRRLLLSRKGASYLTNPHDIVFSGKLPTTNQHTATEPQLAGEVPAGANHRQCFHYLFLLAAYFCGVSIALNLGKQHSVQQLFPPHIMQFLQRQWLQATTTTGSRQTAASSRADSMGILHNWGFFWSSSPLSGEPLSPMILFHVVLASKGLLLIIQVTLQTILIRSSCSQRATRQLRKVYTFLMFSNLSLWAMDIFEQQQHLQRHDYSGTSGLLLDDTTSPGTAAASASVDRLRLITLDGFTQFASSIVTLSHLYHGLVFMQH